MSKNHQKIIELILDKVDDPYYSRQKRVSFWDIRVWLYRLELEEVVIIPTERNKFFRLMKKELERFLGASVHRTFDRNLGKTDNEYANWFFKRSFCWGEG